MGEGYLSSNRYERRKDLPLEDFRLPLYLPVPPPLERNPLGYEKEEERGSLEIIITPKDEKIDGVIILDL